MNTQVTTLKSSVNRNRRVPYQQRLNTLQSEIFLTLQTRYAQALVRGRNVPREPLLTNEFDSILASRVFYRNYEDEFIMFLVIHNLAREEYLQKGVSYWEKSTVVSNYSYGIGKKRFAYGSHYGSGYRLKTVIQLSARETLLRGPSLHDIMHTFGVEWCGSHGVFRTLGIQQGT